LFLLLLLPFAVVVAVAFLAVIPRAKSNGAPIGAPFILNRAMAIEGKANQTNHRKTPLFFAACATLLVVRFASGQGSFIAPSPQENPAYVPTFTFDVASIRENKPSNSYTLTIASPPHAGSFKVTSITAMNLIAIAFGLNHFQITGEPGWAHTARFDVQAKADSSVDEALAKLSNDQASLEKQHMLQMLLVDRFNLKVHEETKDGQAFALTVSKSGPKFQETKPDAPASSEPKDHPAQEMPSFYQRGDGRRGYEFIANGASMKSLAQALEIQFQTPVSDETGLTGKYDFTLQYHGTTTDDSTDDGSVWPPLLTAIQDQLGLKLKSTKAPVKILVIDHIDKPSEN
jgi:uncharacterized protein (TIGR03435 family)